MCLWGGGGKGGVAEWTTASVPTCTVAGSNLGLGHYHSLGKLLFMERNRQPPKHWAW